MDQTKWNTANKDENKSDSLSDDSPKGFKTPVKEENTPTRKAYSAATCFAILPNHITPPSGLTKFIARNPFESDLINRLHSVISSPTIFTKVASPMQCSPGFAWTLEELADVQPAKIEEFPVQQMHCADPEIEIKAQAAIDRFFNENEIIPSPWETRKRVKAMTVIDRFFNENEIIPSLWETRKRVKATTAIDDSNCGTDTSLSKKDGWSQTVLSLPPKLPEHVEEILKPYFTFTQERRNVGENDDANSSNNSLRRKLFFNHNECDENDQEGSMCISLVKMNGSTVLSSSQLQSGMFIHETPLKQCTQTTDRDYTPTQMSRNLSPPNMSPIYSTENNMSCESSRPRSRSVARLDFTQNMSIDKSVVDNKDRSNYQTLDESVDRSSVLLSAKKSSSPSGLYSTPDGERTSPKVQFMPKNSTLVEVNAHSGLTGSSDKHRNIAETFKLLTDSCKIYSNESCVLQQTNAFLANSDQQSVSNSPQDTGYQTYSMNSMTNVTDSYNYKSTPAKQQMYWGEGIALAEDEFGMSDWKENMKDIFSSTPSKYNRGKENQHIV